MSSLLSLGTVLAATLLGASAEPAAIPKPSGPSGASELGAIPKPTGPSGAADSGASAFDAPPPRTPDPADDFVPRPSAYDRERALHGDSDASSEEPSVIAQLGRTLLALLVVVGIIYGLGKLAMARLNNVPLGRLGGRANKEIKVVDRVQLDPKHAVVLVELGSGPRLLLGTGEGGVRLIAEIDRQSGAATSSATAPSTAAPASRTFQQVLAERSEPDAPKSAGGRS